MCDSAFSEERLHALRRTMGSRLSAYRFAHSCGVEREVTALAALYCPGKASMLAAAALLHDLTKEYDEPTQKDLLQAAGVTLRPDEQAPGIWHAMTAPFVIRRDFPDFAVPELLSAVRWHTTGRAGMTLPDALLFLADMTEPGRTFAGCVALRRMLWEPDMQNMTPSARLLHLYTVLLACYEDIQKRLSVAGLPLSRDTAEAAADLQTQITLLERNKT